MSSRPFACAAIFALGIVLAPAARAQFQEPTAPDPIVAVKAELLRIDLDALKDAYRQTAHSLVKPRRSDSDQDREFFAGLEQRKAKLREEIFRMTQELAGLSGQAAPSEDEPGELKAIESRTNRDEPPLTPEQARAETDPGLQLLDKSPEAEGRVPNGPPSPKDLNITPVPPDSPSKPAEDPFQIAPADPKNSPRPKHPEPNPELDKLHSKIRALEEENTRLKDIQSAQARLKTLEEENTFLKAPQPAPAAEVPQPVRTIPEGPAVPQPVEEQSVPILPTSDQAKPDAGLQNREPVQLEPTTPAISPTSIKEPGFPLPTIEPTAETTLLPSPAASEAPKAEADARLDEISRKLDRLIELLTKDRESAPIAPTTTVPH